MKAKRSYTKRKPGVNRKLTPKQTEDLITDYEAGATMVELAMSYGITRQTVGIILRRESVLLRKSGMSDAQAALAIELRGRGMSWAEVGEQLGIHGTTAWRRLRS